MYRSKNRRRNLHPEWIEPAPNCMPGTHGNDSTTFTTELLCDVCKYEPLVRLWVYREFIELLNCTGVSSMCVSKCCVHSSECAHLTHLVGDVHEQRARTSRTIFQMPATINSYVPKLRRHIEKSVYVPTFFVCFGQNWYFSMCRSWFGT